MYVDLGHNHIEWTRKIFIVKILISRFCTRTYYYNYYYVNIVFQLYSSLNRGVET